MFAFQQSFCLITLGSESTHELSPGTNIPIRQHVKAIKILRDQESMMNGQSGDQPSL
jgi:hypothetical protein